jgi:hypothetical protein
MSNSFADRAEGEKDFSSRIRTHQLDTEAYRVEPQVLISPENFQVLFGSRLRLQRNRVGELGMCLEAPTS